MNRNDQSSSPVSGLSGTQLSRRTLLKLAGAGLLLGVVPGGYAWRASVAPTRTNLVLRWDEALLEAVRRTKMAPQITARALAIVHTAMYDAWAPYVRRAQATQPSRRRSREERTLANKSEAISHAAHKALRNLFPTEKTSFDRLMKDLGYNPVDVSTRGSSPGEVGNRAAKRVLDARRDDGSNQANKDRE
ncbi:MAG: DUF6851 domain-containing protein [Rubrobacteraceae bacterium]